MNEITDAPPKTVLIGSSVSMRALRKQIRTVAKVAETVLIIGENGTGKEIVARLIHETGARGNSPWITLNCPVLSPQLFESELFGHKKGSFTGADADRVGRFESAKDGTLLLDEISEINLALQSKLLRVLQENSFERVGSNETIPNRARILATTNRNLPDEVAAGRFREDLYYRLAVLPLRVPPLRHRKDDIPELFEHFLKKSCDRLAILPPKCDTGVMETLSQYDWPGNVRQLEHLVTRMSVFGNDRTFQAQDVKRWLVSDTTKHDQKTVQETSVPGEQEESNDTSALFSGKFSADTGALELKKESIIPATPDTQNRAVCVFTVGTRLEEMEREMIEATLAHFDGHREKTAQTLGIGVRTLQGKLRQYGYAPRKNVVSS